MDNERIFITPGQAISILPPRIEADDDMIHTFINPVFGLVGADLPRHEIVKKITSAQYRELTGSAARGMGHGLALFNDGNMQSDILFVATDEGALRDLERVLAADEN